MNPRQKNIILIVTCAAVFFEALDIAIINLAMPLIQKDLSITNESLPWLQTFYVIPYGGFLIVGGKLADVIGRKQIFLIGSFLFLITSLGAGLSQSFIPLIFFRAVQGLGAALLMPSALSIITNTFTNEAERSRALGIFSSFAALGSGMGLSIGGLMASAFGWQWVFFINIPVILIALVLGYVYIPYNRVEKSRGKPDFASSLLLLLIVLTIAGIIHFFGTVYENFIVLVTLTCVLGLSIFLLIQRSKRHLSLIDMRMFTHPVTLVGNGVSFLLGAFFAGYLFLISTILQNNFGLSAAQSGLLLFPFSILSAICGKFLIPLIMRRFTTSAAALLGMTLMLTGGLLLVASVVSESLSVALFSISCVTGVGMAICFPSLTMMCVQNVSTEHHGVASGIPVMVYFLGGGIGLSILGLFADRDSNGIINIFSPIILTTYALIGATGLLLFYKSRINSSRGV